MMLKSDKIAALIENSTQNPDPLRILPTPDLESLRKDGAASIDLRLGTWFLTLRQSRFPCLNVKDGSGDSPGENRLVRRYYIPFGGQFILHPRNFVLGATLEWIRLPRDLGGYVVGKSSWGRRGLVIATAVGVHPGFSGCLTLEITNLGEVPIAIKPGMLICQLSLHTVDTNSNEKDKSPFFGKRRPVLGSVAPDDFASRLNGEQNMPPSLITAPASTP